MVKSERLRYMRTLYRISQQDLAKALGLTRNYISQIENEKLVFSEEQFKRILDTIYKLGEAKKEGKLKMAIEELQDELKKRINN